MVLNMSPMQCIEQTCKAKMERTLSWHTTRQYSYLIAVTPVGTFPSKDLGAVHKS